ncbi:MAG TPA: MOSC domain-containing protein [Dokdonella sp.]|uniref:MOSC domain-containing protein n=1 Tax=Dokdonella sp. TaxID=2291710 RepID=UPI0025BC5FD4|nr:MOSC domain-containing protein [Dokdonella sp.]MBX3690649.1 MOSC domain-containing protein [Dokdonella sp.]MCW5567543.1 MOSC domain-containing protein [Dokdonella sp.]HNR91431.1 MOSC domain-containing protein [Dokdonella sp.]
MKPTLTALHVFPLKSCAPLSPAEAEVEARGLVADRRWMVVDESGRFLTARKLPRLVLLRARAAAEGLHIDAPGMPALIVRALADVSARRRVEVWGSVVSARMAEPEADAWISAYLGFPAAFVHMDESAVRPVDPAYAQPGDLVSFADGYPLLLISQAALDALNARLAEPVPMLRFRPNLVVDGVAAHAEDGWKRVRIGGIEFDVVKPCIRCVFTTLDFGRGEFSADGEPLRTLLTYRRTPKGVSFGQNLIPRGVGTLRVGAAVEVLA